jgi:hypothetical protein
MENVSAITHTLFVLSTTYVVYRLYKALNRSKTVLFILLAWAAISGALGFAGFYIDGYAIPPRLVFLVGPGIVLALCLFFTPKGRALLDKANVTELTLLQAVRVPVEIVLFQLCAAKLVPTLMTFEGANFDILTGLTSLPVYYFVHRKKILSTKWLLVWNIACLCLLFTIITISILAAATPLQKIAFEQPNTGVALFPYVWLPGLIVPAALFGHLVSIRAIVVHRIRRANNPTPSSSPHPANNPA